MKRERTGELCVDGGGAVTLWYVRSHTAKVVGWEEIQGLLFSERRTREEGNKRTQGRPLQGSL